MSEKEILERLAEIAKKPGSVIITSTGEPFQHIDLRPDADDPPRSEWPKTNINLPQHLIEAMERMRKDADLLMLGELIQEGGGGND